MKVILTTLEGSVYPIEVSDDIEILNLKALCELETNIKPDRMILTFDGKPLNGDQRALASFGVKDNDVIVVQEMRQNLLPNLNRLPQLIDFSSIQIPGATSNGSSRAVSASNNNRQNFNYLDQEEQRRIEERIRLENIQHNMESAIEFMPEAFGNVIMLYIDCKVNGHPVKAFVDSGAQMTIMSARCAERCGIMRLVDIRWSGIARGVGSQKIVGRIHLAQIQIENSFLASSFSVLENQTMDMLLGLDMLKRHQCIIDLKKNVLVINSANVETRFLSESELPAHARLNSMDEQELNQELASTSPQQTPTTPQNEEKIQILCKLGYERSKVVDALNASNGNVDLAKMQLIAQSLIAPSSAKK
jgi:DNA damage-inducible protein 1